MKINNSILIPGILGISAIIGDIYKNKMLSRISLFALVVFGLYKTTRSSDSVSASNPISSIPISSIPIPIPINNSIPDSSSVLKGEKTTFKIDDSLKETPFDKKRVNVNEILITTEEKERLCIISDFLKGIFEGGFSCFFTPKLEITCPTESLFKNICLSLECMKEKDVSSLKKTVGYYNLLRYYSQTDKNYIHPLLGNKIKENIYCIDDNEKYDKKEFEKMLSIEFNFSIVLENIQKAAEFGFYYAIARWERVLIDMKVHERSEWITEDFVLFCNEHHLCSLASKIVLEAMKNDGVFKKLMEIKDAKMYIFETKLYLGKLKDSTYRDQLNRYSCQENYYSEAEKLNQLGIIEEQILAL